MECWLIFMFYLLFKSSIDFHSWIKHLEKEEKEERRNHVSYDIKSKAVVISQESKVTSSIHFINQKVTIFHNDIVSMKVCSIRIIIFSLFILFHFHLNSSLNWYITHKIQEPLRVNFGQAIIFKLCDLDFAIILNQWKFGFNLNS